MKTKNDFTSVSNTKAYASLTPRLVMQLAAPHTWPAAILPVVFACAYAAVTTQHLSVVAVVVLLAICVLMQSSVNTINDYYDYVKGSDTTTNQDDPTDAVLVYNNVSPRSALVTALLFLFVSLCLGVYVIFVAGWVPLAIGLIGAVIVILYSAGKTPISYLPLGEFVSGFTMGILMPLACFQVLTDTFSFLFVLLSLPYFCGIALIMFTNNACDIEKDKESGRKTLAILLGAERARSFYRATMLFWVGCVIVLVAIFFPTGLLMVLFMLLILWPIMQRLWSNPLTAPKRGEAMSACLFMNIIVGMFYVCAILFSGVSSVVLSLF